MICYKVINHQGTDLVSAIGDALPKEWCVFYKPTGEWATARNNSGLFVFETHEAATTYMNGLPNPWHQILEIWECECEESLPVPRHVPCLVRIEFGSENNRKIQDLWDPARKEDVPGMRTPVGTALFRRIRLITKLEELAR